MSVQQGIEDELPFLRAEAEARMLDTCRITRAGLGPGTFDHATGQYEGPEPQTIYGPDRAPALGRCRIAAGNSSSSVSSAGSTAGEATWGTQDVELRLPVVGSGGVRPNDVVEYLDSAHGSDLAGYQFGVVAVRLASQGVERRVRMRRVSAT